MDTQLTEFSLIETVRDTAKFAAKIDQLLQATKNYEAAKEAADATYVDLKKKKIETDNYVNGRKAELAAAQVEHDKVAKEAADRIELGRQQVAEALKLRDANTAMAAHLEECERDLIAREKILKDQESGIAVRQAAIEKSADLIHRQLAHINAMPKQ